MSSWRKAAREETLHVTARSDGRGRKLLGSAPVRARDFTGTSPLLRSVSRAGDAESRHLHPDGKQSWIAFFRPIELVCRPVDLRLRSAPLREAYDHVQWRSDLMADSDVGSVKSLTLSGPIARYGQWWGSL